MIETRAPDMQPTISDASQPRLKVLISAYTCVPYAGSEPGVGWNIVQQMSRFHEVWVITETYNQQFIEPEMARQPLPNVHWHYYRIPRWQRWWYRYPQGEQLHYYLWQLGVSKLARQLNAQIGFDVVHHATYVKYWAPVGASNLDVPFVWGPVGGGERSPSAFLATLNRKGQIKERLRTWIQRLSHVDPNVRKTARRATVTLATTRETAQATRQLNGQAAHIMPVVALNDSELSEFGAIPLSGNQQPHFVSIGRLLDWKGFHLGLQAFAQIAEELPAAQYTIIGDGSDRARLETLAQEIGIAHRVTFTGNLSRSDMIETLARCDVLVHPSLHDSGGGVCAEAMAAGRPVICLDVGGPALQVTPATGYAIPAYQPPQAVRDIADAMRALAEPRTRQIMGNNARRHANRHLSWSQKGARLNEIYWQVQPSAIPMKGR